MDTMNDSVVTTSFPPNVSANSSVPTVSVYSIPLIQRWLMFRAIFLPILMLLGVLGNTMTIVIVRRFKANRTAMSRYFLSLAVTDLCYIFTGPFPVWFRSATGVRLLALHDAVCKIDVFVLNVASASSAWILVTMATHRAVMAMWPHRVNGICTARRSWGAIITIVVFLCLADSHYLYGASVITTTIRVCSVKEDYSVFLNDVWFKVEVFSSSISPMLCMLLCNCVLARKLRVSVREMSDQPATSDSQLTSRVKTVNSVTLTTIVVTMTFVVLTLPLTAWSTISYVTFEEDYADINDYALDMLIQDAFYMFVYVNYSVNFYLYCLTGKKFRNDLKIILCGLTDSARRDGQAANRA